MCARVSLYDQVAFEDLPDIGVNNRPSKCILDSIIYQGNSALGVAVQFSNLSNVVYLIDLGVDVDLCDRNQGGEPPIKIAIDNGNLELFNLLKKAGANLDAKGWMGISARDRIIDQP